MVYLFGCLVAWFSTKQITPALSSCEAEYVAAGETLKDVLHMSSLVGEIMDMPGPVPLHLDNKGAGFLAENSLNNKRSKHIDIRHHFIRHYLDAGRVELFWVASAQNVADIFTKSVGPEVFVFLRGMLFGRG